MVSRRGAAGRTENKVDSRRRRETRCMNMGAHTCTLHKPSSPCWSGLSRKFLARPWCTHIRVHGGRTNSRVATDRGRSLLHPSRTSTALLIRLNNSTAVIDPSPPECKYFSRNSHRRWFEFVVPHPKGRISALAFYPPQRRGCSEERGEVDFWLGAGWVFGEIIGGWIGGATGEIKLRLWFQILFLDNWTFLYNPFEIFVFFFWSRILFKTLNVVEFLYSS